MFTRKLNNSGIMRRNKLCTAKFDSEFYHNMFCRPGGAFDMIEAKMPWLRGREFKIQQDGARSHTGTNTVEELQAGGTGDGWVPIILTQPPNSPDVNINDLGFFSSLKYHVSQICTHCTSIEEMMNNVIRAFDEYPADKLEDKWACYYNNLRSIMSCLSGNDYKQAHNGGKRCRQMTGTSVDLSISLDDYDRCLAYIAE